MAQVTNPRKAFQFTITIPGFNPFLAQEVTEPELEVEPVHHGDTNFDVKTAGRVKIGVLHIKKLSTAFGPDNFFWQWFTQAMDTFRGGGDIPPAYWKTIIVDEFAIDGKTIINTSTYIECWPHKKHAQDWKRMESANKIEAIDFCINQAQLT